MPCSAALSLKAGQTDVFQVVGGSLVHYWLVAGSWHSETVAGPSGGVSTMTATFPPQVPQTAILGGQVTVCVEDQGGAVWYFAQGLSSQAWGANKLP
jgi:hypothetical protein